MKTEAIHELEKKIEALNSQILSADKITKQTIKQERHNTEARLFEIYKTRRFRIKPIHYSSVRISVKLHHMAITQNNFRCKITQFPLIFSHGAGSHADIAP